MPWLPSLTSLLSPFLPSPFSSSSNHAWQLLIQKPVMPLIRNLVTVPNTIKQTSRSVSYNNTTLLARKSASGELYGTKRWQTTRGGMRNNAGRIASWFTRMESTERTCFGGAATAGRSSKLFKHGWLKGRIMIIRPTPAGKYAVITHR